MKKRFNKITIFALVALISLSSGGFCFKNLVQASNNLGPVSIIHQNTDVSKPAMPAAMIDCNKHVPAAPSVAYFSGQGTFNIDNLVKQVAVQETTSKKNKDILPCCMEGNSSSDTTFTQGFEFSHNLFAIAAPAMAGLLNIRQTAIYHAPEISPPQLLAVKTTVLRL